MAAFVQRIRCEAPASVLPGNHRTQYGITVVDRDRGARLGGTAQGRRVIIRYVAAVQCTRVFSCIISHLQIADRIHDCVHRQLKRRGTLADVPSLVGHGGAQAVVALVQGIRREAPASVLPGNHRTQYGVAVVDRDCGPRLGGTAQGRRGVVGQIAAGQRAGMPGHIVGHQQIADRSHDCIHRQLKRRGTLADVPRLIRHGGAQAVVALVQGVRRESPASVLPGNHRTQYGVTVVDRDRGARLGGTAQGRRGVVGQIAAGQRAGMPGHVVGHLQIADRSHRRVHCNFKRRGTLADVPGLVGHGGAQAVAAFVQRIRGVAPASVLAGNHGTQHRVAVIDGHRGTRLRRAAQGRRGVVGQITAGQRAGMPGHVIGHLRRTGRRRGGINRQFKRRGTLADVPGLVRHGGAQAVAAFVQRLRGVTPASVLAGNHRTQYGVTVVDRDRGARLGGTAQGRRGVVGQIAAGQRAGMPGHIVGHQQIADRSHDCIHRQLKRRGTLADVPGLVGHGGAQVVVALVQGIRREAPASVLAGNHRTQYGITVVDRDRGARLGGTAQGRRGVVGQIAAGQRAGVSGHIVSHLQIADRSHDCVHRQLKRRGTLADISGLVGHGGAQAVVALVQGIRREAPASVLPGNHRTQYGVAVVDRDCGPRLGGTAQGRRGVVGQIAAGQRAGMPGHIVGHLQTADRSHRRVHCNFKRRRALADIPRLIRHGGAQAVVALVQGVRRESPASVLPGNHRTQYGVTVVDRDRGARLGGTAQGRRGVVGQIAAGQRAGMPGHIVGHLQIADRSHNCIHRQFKRRGTLADIPGLVGHGGAQAVAAFVQRIRGVAPASVLAGNHGTQHRVAVIDRDRGPRLGGTAQGRRGVVGQIAAGQRAGMPGHIVGHLQTADRSHDCIHRQLKHRGALADVPRLIRHRGAQAVAAFIQCIRGVAPASVLAGNHGTQHRVAVVDRDRGPRLRRAAQGRRGVVGQIAAGQRAGMPGHIVGHLQTADRSHDCIHRQLKHRGALADVPRLIRHRGAQAVAAFIQCIRGVAPASVLAGNHGTQHRVAVVDRDRGPRLRRAAQGWCGVVGQIAAGQRAGVSGHVVGHLRRTGRRRGGINCQLKRRGALADVPRLIRHRGAQAVAAFIQCIRGVAPASVLAGNHGTQHRVAVVDRDRGPRLRRAAQGWCGVVGQIAAGQRAGVSGHVVGHLRRTGRRRGGINCQLKHRRALADVPGLVGHRSAQAMRTFAKLR